MDFRRRLGVMVPVTCTYWRNASCFRGDRCTFVHGFICRDDGICSDPLCNKAHFKQRDPCTYLKAPNSSSNLGQALLTVNHSHTVTQSSRETRETHETRVVRPRHRTKSRSPKRRSRSPYSPKRRQSPRRTSRKSRTPSYSPRSRSRSHSRGRRRSRSRSRSQRRRSYSPYKKSVRSKSRSRSRSNQSSPCRKSVSPGSKSSSSSPVRSPDAKESERLSKEKLKLIRNAEKELDDALVVKTDEDMFFNASKEKDASDKESKPRFKPIGDPPIKMSTEASREKETSKKVSPELSPSLRALEILKNLPKDFFKAPEDESEAKIEEKESHITTNDEESFKEAFFKALNPGGGESTKDIQSGNLPPVLKHPLNAESLAKPFQDKLYSYEEQSSHTPSPGSNLWAPSVDRNKSMQAKTVLRSQTVSNWEIDTPYIGRNSRSSDDLAVVEAGSSKEMPPPASAADEYKKKKKKKRRRSSSSSSSSSSSDDDEPRKSETDEAALNRKKKILSKVWTLMAQKKKLETQRDETVLNHKGDGKSLAVLLKENSALSSEIDRQIFLMNQMVQTINEKLGISKTEAQQQEFFFQPSMYKDSKALQAAGKKALSEKSLQKSITKFLKPSEESSKKSSPSSPIRRSKRGSRSPSRRQKKPSPPSPVRRSKKQRSRSRSKSRSRSRDRKRSPSFEKKATRKHGSEKKGKKEKSPVMEDSKSKKKKEVKKSPASITPAKAKIVQQKSEKNDVEYSPSPAMKPHVKYIDQGMHWCKLCNEFLDTVQDFINHLESANHLEKLSSDLKPWLPKPANVEKDPVDPNAPVITIPLQGMEFIHSITAFFCSLCDTFVKSKEEAQSHSETKLHVSKYKDHLSHNPMYEASYVKGKMAAFAKYSVDMERRKEKNPSLENTNNQDFFGEVKKKTDEDPGVEEQAFLGHPKAQEPQTVNSVLTPSNALVNAASIRVASRSSVSSSIGAEEIDMEQLHTHSNCKSPKGSVFQPPPSPIPPPHPLDEPMLHNKSEKTFLDEINDGKKSLREDEERKLQALKKRVAEYKEHPAPTVQKKCAEKNVTDGDKVSRERERITSVSPQRDSQQQSSKLAIKKYSNVIIGKMPFLKRSKATSCSKTENKNQEEELPSASEAEERIRQIVSDGFSIFSSSSDHQNAGAFPSTVPRNTEYITEIETCESGTTFTKKFGPTMNPEGFSDDDDNSEEAPMDISHDEDSDKEEVSITTENVPSLMDIPVPVDPRRVLNRPASPLESKLKVDMNNPHLSQLSVAAAMYKDGIAYQPLPIPPAPYLQMPPVPPMMNPMYAPYGPHPHSIHDEYVDGVNPPPPGTEEGNSNQSSANHDGLDSPDSFLCQKTPPPPGTEDENLKLPRQDSVNKSNPQNGQDYFQDMLADLPVLSYANSSQTAHIENDEGSQESLVQEGLELLEFADEDEEKSGDKLLKNKSPPPTPSPENILREAEMPEMDLVSQGVEI